jgi:ribosomal protein S3
MTALTPDKIAELLSKGRARGAYDPILSQFIDSGEAGIEVEFTGTLAGRNAKQVKTGLDAARKRTDGNGSLVHAGAQNVRVIEADGSVYLINTTVVTDEEA